jgi:hypothetical protein
MRFEAGSNTAVITAREMAIPAGELGDWKSQVSGPEASAIRASRKQINRTRESGNSFLYMVFLTSNLAKLFSAVTLRQSLMDCEGRIHRPETRRGCGT